MQLTTQEQELIRGAYEARGFKVRFDDEYVYISSKEDTLLEKTKNIFYIKLMRNQ